MQDFWFLVAGAGLALLGGVGTQLLIGTREGAARRATVRDSAYKDAVEACAEFVGASHLHLSRLSDVVATLARLKVKHPDLEYVGAKLDRETVNTIIHPAIAQRLAAAVRAEVLVEQEVMVESIQRMQDVTIKLADLVHEGNHGRLPEDWSTQLSQLRADHDRSSTVLVERLRQHGAATTYRKLS